MHNSSNVEYSVLGMCLCRLDEVCSHVAAVLFKIEAAFRLGVSNPSCTSMQCTWNQAFTKKVCM